MKTLKNDTTNKNKIKLTGGTLNTVKRSKNGDTFKKEEKRLTKDKKTDGEFKQKEVLR